MTSQRPCRQAIERTDEKVQQWLDVLYPEIIEKAKADKGIIYWSDESAIKHNCNWETDFAPKGQTLVLKCSAGRWTTATMVSAVSNRGLLRFKIQDKLMI